MIHESSGSQMETALPCVSKYMVACHMTGVKEGDGELLVFDGWGSGMLSTLAEPSSRGDCPAQDASITLFRNAVWFLRHNWLFFEIVSFVVLTFLIILLNYNCIYVQVLILQFVYETSIRTWISFYYLWFQDWIIAKGLKTRLLLSLE